jgi:DNA modification methylase
MLTIKPGDCRDVLRAMPDKSVHCCVTSPPYFGLRDYGVPGQIGLEPTPDAYVAELVAVFREVRRVLRDDGTLWLNLGDSYARAPTKGGSGPNGKNEDRWGYGQAQRAFRPGSGRADGVVDARGQRNRDGVGPVAGLKEKDLIGIPWRVAFALQADGWYLRQDIIWSKPNPMPESVTDRCTKAHEYIFLMSKQARYFYDAAAIAEEGEKVGTLKHLLGGNGERAGTRQGLRPQNGAAERLVAGCQAVTGSDVGGSSQFRMMRNKRSVWEVATQPFAEAHFATFPPDLIEPCIKAGCPKGGTVLDPFGGAGTTGLVADRLGRSAILIELNPEYAAMTERRIRDDAGMFTELEVSP